MPLENSLQRLAENVAPRDAFARTVKSRLMRRIGADELRASALATRPSSAFHSAVKQRILQVVRPPLAESLLSLVSRTHPLSERTPSFLRHTVTVQPPRIHSWIKWSAAFALFLLIIRSMPLILLAPSTMAETSVQVLPAGDGVTIFIGGVWQNVTEPLVLTGPAMISTGVAEATIILDGGVFRLSPETTVKIHTVGSADSGPTATLVRGQLWALGLLPPVVEGLTLETDAGILLLNAGSASVHQTDSTVAVAIYDKGVTFTHDGQQMFLIAGEKTSFINGRTTSIQTMPVSVFADPLVAENLSHDAVHREQIAALQQERRIEMAGILPTSAFFYEAKRIAEHVDVFFALTHDGKTEKRLEQANTRLSEALALLKDGNHDQAQIPLAEYSHALVSLASDAEDNIVQDIIRQQIVEASSTLTAADDNTQKNIAFLQEALHSVDDVVPDAKLSSLDIQGYVLVDTLSAIHKLLTIDRNPDAAVSMYVTIRPYLSNLLADGTGTHPLLQREANAYLFSIASHLRDEQNNSIAKNELFAAMVSDLSSYLPEDTQSIEELNAAADTYVQAARARILVFDTYISRYNELFREMDVIISDVKNNNRGFYLRKLQEVLPTDLGEYVNVGIKRLGDELKSS